MLVAPLNYVPVAAESNLTPARFAAQRRADLARRVQAVAAAQAHASAWDALLGLAEDEALGDEPLSAPPHLPFDLHFVYRAVRENGRVAAKRATHNTDEDWSFLMDRHA